LKDIAGVLETGGAGGCVMMMDVGIWLRFKMKFSPAFRNSASGVGKTF
jgi:hypothetical protein